MIWAAREDSPVLRHTWQSALGALTSVLLIAGCPRDGGPASTSVAPGHDVTRTLPVGGLRRAYRLYVPGSYDGQTPTALLLVFHGSGGSGENIERWSGFDALADQSGFIVCYPDGVDQRWNAAEGTTVGNIDDVGFVRALIENLAGTYPIDPRRVFAAGMSMGGVFCQRLGLELSDQIAAIAPVAGSLPEALADEVPAQPPVSVVAFHGTADGSVPFDGGDVLQGAARVLGAEQTARRWAELDGCPLVPAIEQLPDVDPSDGTRVRREGYAPGQDGAEVVLYVIEGGGHTWPGVDETQFPQHSKAVTHDINAAALIWDFFQNHPKP
jgi:polyhydroxybutyrate depolymerase